MLGDPLFHYSGFGGKRKKEGRKKGVVGVLSDRLCISVDLVI